MKIKLRKSPLVILMSLVYSFAFSQTGTVQGKITDDKGEALIGATVLLKGTTVGTITDMDGNYSISALPAGENILDASYVGYQLISKCVSDHGCKRRSSRDVDLMKYPVRHEEALLVRSLM